jgi:nitroimidazol reductase NimA-like FMN-containing flavoprotein (pyridoxamine 5'-phosphate oxidase superfamily)
VALVAVPPELSRDLAPDLTVTPRSTVRRKKERGLHDRAAVNAILDEGLICHVGFVSDGAPVVIPTAYGRVGDHLYLHGAVGNHMLRSMAEGGEACVTVTLLDGLVLARSAFHHSMNYRSVVLFGVAEKVTDEEEKAAALEAIVEHLVPGRTADARGSNPAELRSTLVVRLPIDEGSAKVRTGAPIDDEDDLDLPVWAGVVPLTLTAGPPVSDTPDLPVPAYAASYSRTAAPSSGKTFDTLPSR